MKKPFIYSTIFAVIALSSCKVKDNTVAKIANANSFQNEFNQDSTGTKQTYLNRPVELTGTFTKNGDFVLYQFDSVNNSYNYSSIVVLTTLKRHDSIAPAELNSGWYYNKETGTMVDQSTDFRIDQNGILMDQGAHLFSMEDVFRLFRDIKDGVTYTSDDLDRILDKYIKNENLIKGIQNNQVAIYNGESPGDLIVVEKVKVSGTITDMQRLGDKIFVHLSADSKVVGKEKVFNFNKLPVIDYNEVKGILVKKEAVDSTSQM